MNKIMYFSIGFFFLFMLFVLPLSISAQSVEKTVVNGQVTDASHHGVNGASVQISCNGNNATATTDSNGDYSYTYDGVECPVGKTVTAHAVAGSQTGNGSGSVAMVYSGGSVQINLALVNISVPEFGLITGFFTTVVSAGAFLMLKKRVA